MIWQSLQKTEHIYFTCFDTFFFDMFWHFFWPTDRQMDGEYSWMFPCLQRKALHSLQWEIIPEVFLVLSKEGTSLDLHTFSFKVHIRSQGQSCHIVRERNLRAFKPIKQIENMKAFFMMQRLLVYKRPDQAELKSEIRIFWEKLWKYCLFFLFS